MYYIYLFELYLMKKKGLEDGMKFLHINYCYEEKRKQNIYCREDL